MFALQALQSNGRWYTLATYATRQEACHNQYDRAGSILRAQRNYRVVLCSQSLAAWVNTPDHAAWVARQAVCPPINA